MNSTPDTNNGDSRDTRVSVNLPEEGVDQPARTVLENLEGLPDKLSELADDTSVVDVTVIALPPRGGKTSG